MYTHNICNIHSFIMHILYICYAVIDKWHVSLNKKNLALIKLTLEQEEIVINRHNQQIDYLAY